MELTQYLKNQHRLHRKYVLMLIERVHELLVKLPNIVDVDVPTNGLLTICGDIHGQYYDLLKLLELNGGPSSKHFYMFNGDFVDRGSFSVEVILLLIAWKCLYPDYVHLIRGNHENKQVHKWHG
jgi:serine/threonine-protein phosphatase 5